VRKCRLDASGSGAGYCERGNELPGVIPSGEFLDKLSDF
jgi:hypothetical protein